MLQSFYVPAGGRIINARGLFFEYRECISSGVDQSVRVRADGQDLGTFLPGDTVTLPVEASMWEVTPADATAMTNVRVGQATVRSNRLSGAVSSLNEVSSACQTWNVGDTNAGFRAVAIITPAANVRGVIVRSAIAETTPAASSNQNVRCLASPAAPLNLGGSPSPTAQQLIIVSVRAVGGIQSEVGLYDIARKIPAGWGLYFAANGSAAPVTANITLSAEVL